MRASRREIWAPLLPLLIKYDYSALSRVAGNAVHAAAFVIVKLDSYVRTCGNLDYESTPRILQMPAGKREGLSACHLLGSSVGDP